MRKVAVVGAGMTPFAEHFAHGIKDLLPMAYAEAAASVDKGINKNDLQAAWFGAMGTTDGFPSGILADSLGLPDIPVTRIENSCATGNDAVRNALYGIASGAFPEQDLATTVPLVNACLTGRGLPDDGADREHAIEQTEAFVLRAVGARVPVTA